LGLGVFHAILNRHSLEGFWVLRVGVAVVGFSLFALFAKAAPQLNSCDESSLPPCAVLAKAPINFSSNDKLGFDAPRNGGVIFNIFSAKSKLKPNEPLAITDTESPALLKMETVAPARAEKSLAFVDTIRKRAIDVIAGTIRPEDFSSEQKVLIERLKTLRIAKASVGDKLCSIDEPPGIPNTNYDVVSHTLTLCPASLNLSEAQLIQEIGHELGHVVNPCVTTNTLYQVDRDRATVENFRVCDPSLIKDGEGDKQSDDNLAITRMLTSETSYAIGSSSIPFIRMLLRCNLIHAVSSDGSIKSSTLFAGTFTCLDHAYSSEYNDDHQKDVFAIEARDFLTESKARAKARNLFPPACFREENEAFADAFSARMIGEMSPTLPPSELKAAFLSRLGFSCFEKRAGVSTQVGYSPAGRRLATTMSDSAIATQLQCTPVKDAKVCPLDINYSNPAKKPTKPTPKKTAPAVH
jgi:hypothetical protein